MKVKPKGCVDKLGVVMREEMRRIVKIWAGFRPGRQAAGLAGGGCSEVGWGGDQAPREVT